MFACKLTIILRLKIIREKKIINSKELLTGFLNLTIDKAPIIPKDKAKSNDLE